MSFMDEDGWYIYNDNDGCTVPVFGKKELFSNDNNHDGGRNQNLILSLTRLNRYTVALCFRTIWREF